MTTDPSVRLDIVLLHTVGPGKRLKRPRLGLCLLVNIEKGGGTDEKEEEGRRRRRTTTTATTTTTTIAATRRRLHKPLPPVQAPGASRKEARSL